MIRLFPAAKAGARVDAGSGCARASNCSSDSHSSGHGGDSGSLTCYTRKASETTGKQRRSSHRFVIQGHLSLLLPPPFSRRRVIFTVGRKVVFCWLSCVKSSCRCFCASSWLSGSVLKKSASVVTRDSALMVAVLKCFSTLYVSQGCP